MKEVSWPAYPYRPKVDFTIAHTGRHILLKYYVEEQHLCVVNVQVNSPVYEDSCVEFFIAFDNLGYYNLEFNCIGTTLAGYGSSKSDRLLLDTTLIRQIRYEATLSNEKEDLYKWKLMLVIPMQIFKYHSINSLNGLRCKANFYKCGDLTALPHFLSWTPIEAPEPDFHLTRFFGTLVFQ